ncbi:hypothetical protein TTHERM_000307678 (macronuclear) [Tetrahymena thermophila SB210]|uniref:Uncharacterized protein n=1 Tax=Tetrahymena thermophila (strain SB210) TaxID=312017 RepID=W7XG99_TETTS|nr:hypothetical protein TTHERM_000307678 [Tetrahymena thermophila SB210]EWS73126.1 hypothetical protein TTHERM_000307678 [Tetrahymena thermophila SB210]|eukprot:XP_012654313.1 hypothetical protein TTHERM_000307678 [Tetrahymena thermophila SB210]
MTNGKYKYLWAIVKQFLLKQLKKLTIKPENKYTVNLTLQLSYNHLKISLKNQTSTTLSIQQNIFTKAILKLNYSQQIISSTHLMMLPNRCQVKQKQVN